MAQSVIVKKEEKVNAVFEAMKNTEDMEEFKQLFKSMYPKDWERVKQRYNQHEQHNTTGKGHPMPEPEKYLANMFKVYHDKKPNKRKAECGFMSHSAFLLLEKYFIPVPFLCSVPALLAAAKYCLCSA